MIVYHGQVKSITLDEIEGAYKIAIIHVGHPSNFLWGWEGLFGRSGGVSGCEELVEHQIEHLVRGVAEGEGFEPSVHFRVRHISNVLV